MNINIYDMIGIGIGPFNLGLAALLDKVPDLNCLFIDERPGFEWHKGMLIPGARMQVPFYADLVTLADPKSPYSFLNYLHVKQKHFRFANSEMIYPLRKEYNDYYKWVAGQLNNLQFNTRCEKIIYKPVAQSYCVTLVNTHTHDTQKLECRKIVVGIGMAPHLPPFIQCKRKGVIHSSEYLLKKKTVEKTKDIAVVGSGQSAAEIFLDLLNDYPKKIKKIAWYCKGYIAPMDDSKMTIEMTTPEYIKHFFNLPPKSKMQVLKGQDQFYKGISRITLNAIAEKLYILSAADPKLLNGILIRPHSELVALQKQKSKIFDLVFTHRETESEWSAQSGSVVLATGYRNRKLDFLSGIEGLHIINGEYYPDENYSIDDRKSIYVQNADLNTHGFNSADLELGPKRNAVIINALLGSEFYAVETGKGFQSFD